jgi:hypothetical protein
VRTALTEKEEPDHIALQGTRNKYSTQENALLIARVEIAAAEHSE